MLSGSQIRQKFLDYFAQRGHKIVHSSSLVPQNDPTLLFTNAGMNQFKDVFLGLEKRDYNRATTSQKCVRAGGKHNDLENVGFTNRHHTFFEMLGNFSFGDYFKREAIAYAWELITSPEWYGIDKSKLYVTIFNGEGGLQRDEDAEKFWMEVGVPKERIFAMGAKDNFWAMGDTGPCGPCSEIHYDMGIESSDKLHPECAAGNCQFPCPHDCGRYVEIWNLVFMQFDRDSSGKLNPLPKPSIDTGAGLERMAAVLQGVVSNYDTDLFTPLVKRAAELTGVSAKKETEKETHSKNAASLRVIADHARATTFLISDGVLPGNEGRSYVLRKIIRRAIRHGRLLGQEKPFLYEMVNAVRDLMKDAYPELIETAERVSNVVHEEEVRFIRTIGVGLRELDSLIEKRRKESEAANHPAGLHGKDAFYLYETFGLPIDFIEDAVRDQGLLFNRESFEKEMAEERERARASWKGGTKAAASPAFRDLAKTVFEGYSQTESSGCQVLAIVHNGIGVPELKAGQEGEIVLDHTPFYADSGGQVGDTGWFYSDDRNTLLAEVRGAVMPVQGVRVHKVVAKHDIRVRDRVTAVVNTDVRQSIVRHHTGTHLLHAALREILGKHVKQAGSLVDPSKLRFDFSHFTGVADEELQDIEDLANKEILRNTKVQVINDVPIDVAVNEYKAMALFGEKYGDKVRVIKIGDFSTELCGGIHTVATGEIGLLKLLHESSVSSGVRRVEAVAGEQSLRHFRADHQVVDVASQLLGQPQHAEAPAESFKRALLQKDEELKKLRKELEQARMKSASASVSASGDNVKNVNGIKVIAQRVDNIDRNQMRTLVDNLRNKLGSGVVVLGSAMEVDGDKRVAIIVGVTKDLTGRIQAGKIIGPIANKVGGSGGGRPDMAEAGGKNPAALDQALNDVPEVIEGLLK
ncbi:MAG: alanyl-tRNA synthetase [Candidatus Angelobacter sp.]|nr:alanyl-tRNA synthetase [Candidatus Angelobacter sp.]